MIFGEESVEVKISYIYAILMGDVIKSEGFCVFMIKVAFWLRTFFEDKDYSFSKDQVQLLREWWLFNWCDFLWSATFIDSPNFSWYRWHFWRSSWTFHDLDFWFLHTHFQKINLFSTTLFWIKETFQYQEDKDFVDYFHKNPSKPPLPLQNQKSTLSFNKRKHTHSFITLQPLFNINIYITLY